SVFTSCTTPRCDLDVLHSETAKSFTAGAFLIWRRRPPLPSSLAERFTNLTYAASPMKAQADRGQYRQAAGAIAQLLASRDGAYYLPSGARTPIQASRTC